MPLLALSLANQEFPHRIKQSKFPRFIEVLELSFTLSLSTDDKLSLSLSKLETHWQLATSH